MKVKNKKLAKVSFFLFLFFSFLALGFTLSNSVSAYTSEDMPQGYRPITYADQGKVFGVDLEPVIYFDTSAVSNTNLPSNIAYLYFSDSTKPYFAYASSGRVSYWPISGNNVTLRDANGALLTWVVDSFTLENGNFIKFGSESSATYFSSFLYVKPIVEEILIVDSILSLFNNLVIWIPSVLTGLILMFYSSETGLTFLGALAVAGLGISVIFLLIGIIQNFLHFRS